MTRPYSFSVNITAKVRSKEELRIYEKWNVETTACHQIRRLECKLTRTKLLTLTLLFLASNFSYDI